MLVSLEYPHGQKATKWQKNILAGAEAMEIIPSTRRIAKAITARFFAEKAMNLEWGVGALSQDDLTELQHVFDVLAGAEISWFVPEYTVQSLQLFDVMNDLSKQALKKNVVVKKARMDRTVRFAAPLYMRIADEGKARLIAGYMKKLPYLGRSESIVVVDLHGEDEVDLSGHQEYLRSPSIALKSMHSIELSPGCSVEEVIDTAPLAKFKVGPTSKLAMPKGCVDMWWYPVSQAVPDAPKAQRNSDVQGSAAMSRDMFLSCPAPNHLAPALTLALLDRISKAVPGMQGITLRPVTSDSGMELLGWECHFSQMGAMLAVASIGHLRLPESTRPYPCSLGAMPPRGEVKSQVWSTLTPVLLEDCDTLEEAMECLMAQEEVDSVEITELHETTMGTALSLNIVTQNPVPHVQLGAMGDLGMGYAYPSNRK